MPPKPKFTKEQIVSTALELVAESGMGALTARELGDKLGSSARPIFTLFKNMEELQETVRSAALEHFKSYYDKTDASYPKFKRVGMQMILFAMKEPNLFKLVYMSDNKEAKNFDDVFERLGDDATDCIGYIKSDYGLTDEEASKLFEHSWIYTYGISVLCATGMCRFTPDEISGMMTEDFRAMMVLIKSGGNRTED